MAGIVMPEKDAFWIEHLDDEQISALATFRDALEAEKLTFEGHQDDTTFCRFLKARKWEVDKALAMWRNMHAWRKSFAEVPAQPPFSTDERAAIKRLYPHFSHKTDVYGRPVHYELLGQLDLPGLMRLSTVERLIKHHTLGWERTKSVVFPACCVAAQRQVYTIVTVLDLKGLKMAAFTKDVRAFVAAISKIDQHYYPEHLGQMFIVNAPMVFKAIWSAVSPWLEARTKTKIQVFSSEKQSREALLSVIPRQNLIKSLGGDSEPDIMSELGEGPWANPEIREKGVRGSKAAGRLQANASPHRYWSTALTSSSISADTVVGLVAA